MKTKHLCALFIFSSLSFSALSFAGPRTDGGGNIEHATEKQLEEVTDWLPYRSVWYLPERSDFARGHLQDPELRNAFSLFLGPEDKNNPDKKTPITRAIDATWPFSVKLKEKCHGPEGDVDASTPYKKGSVVCLSKSRLLQLPVETLEEELVALYLHEMAHQFGLNERVAVKVQKYIRARVLIQKQTFSGQCADMTRPQTLRDSAAKAIALPKNFQRFHTKIADSQTFNATSALKLETYTPWLVKELNNDSLIVEQIAESFFDNMRSGDFRYYVNGHGINCRRPEFTERSLSLTSAKSLGKDEQGNETIEIKFKITQSTGGHHWSGHNDENFTMLVGIPAHSPQTPTLMGYPQWTHQDQYEDWVYEKDKD